MTGPHPSRQKVGAKRFPVWSVAIVDRLGGKPLSKVYRCLSYRRAVSLSCNIAHDRSLFLHIEAVPR
jgi:hypothetical protein